MRNIVREKKRKKNSRMGGLGGCVMQEIIFLIGLGVCSAERQDRKRRVGVGTEYN